MKAIKIENISKKYEIRHSQYDSYRNLRDTIAKTASDMVARTLKPFRRQNNSEDFKRETFWALKDVSVEVEQGERIGIIGRNGAGKSTLLKILSRIVEPSTGSVRIRGRLASLLEVGTGFHPELSGSENIFLNGALLGMSKVEIGQKFDEIVAFAEVGKFIDTPVKRYSSGMYVRLAFSVAAHLDPDILIIDEVLAVGDAQFQQKCIGKLNESSAQGKTIVLVSHNMGLVATLCNKAMLLEHGKVKSFGNAENVIKDYLENSTAEEKAGTFRCDQREGKAWISRAIMCNDTGEIQKFYLMSAPICLNIQIVVRDQTSLKVGVQIREMNDVPIVHFSNIDSGFHIPNSPGLHEIGIKIPPLYLYPGKYRMSLSLGTPTELLQAEEITFQVDHDYSLCSRPLGRHGGIIFAFADWRNS